MPAPASPGVLRTPAWARTIEALPPAIRYQLAEALAVMPAAGGGFDGVARTRFEQLMREGDGWLGAEPRLAELGFWMIEPGHAVELRRQGCRWLARFPSVDMVKRLAPIALDAGEPPALREQAIAALGCRQLRALHASTRWTPDAAQLADEVLIRLAGEATVAGKITSARLPEALRHVTGDGLAAVFARAPGLWGDALEWFATPPLARVLAVSIDDIPAIHRQRVLRLVAATLGEEFVPLLRARASRAAPGDQLEMLLLAIALGGEAHLGALEDRLRGGRLVEPLRARARWHLQHRGVVPTVRGLRVARTTALLAPGERAERCAQAADDLAALARFERHTERYLYTLWGWMVRAAGDPARARELIAAHPASRAQVRDLHLEDLARRGRVSQLVAAAHASGGAATGALALAIWGRPLAALALAASGEHTAELAVARALACYRAGRPDLTERILADDLPPAEVTDDELRRFPGPHEQWLIANAAALRPAVAALASGRDAILALAQPVPLDADPDEASLEAVAAIDRRLGSRLRGELTGATVYIAGDVKPARRDRLAATLAAQGARLVAGPLPGTDYYVAGDGCSAQRLAQLERQGVRQLAEPPPPRARTEA